MKARLLAKRMVDRVGLDPEELYLAPHLLAAEKAGATLASAIGARLLRQAELDDSWVEILDVVLPTACLLHDLGKANDSFQTLVKSEGFSRARQPIRHEFLSILMLMKFQGIQRFCDTRLDHLDESKRLPALNSVYGGIGAHHLKLDPELRRACSGYHDGSDRKIHVYASDSELQPLFGEISDKDLTLSFLSFENDSVHPLIELFRQKNREWRRFLEKNSDWHKFASLIRPLVICADVLASALVPDGIEYESWLQDSLSNVLSNKDLIGVVSARLGTRSPRRFQVAISESQADVTLVQAGCGSGKTVGAYMWAANTAPGRKLVFCYPTTGTATEGFLNYVTDSDVEAALIHSRARIDLMEVMKTGEEEGDELHERLHAVEAYDPRVVVCTIDTVLGLMVNGRSALMRMPAFANAVFVFDEVHSYSARLFAAMIQFMECFSRSKFLLMSASLQGPRLKKLLEHFPSAVTIDSPRELMDLKRYVLLPLHQESLADADLESVVKDKKVLAVANTVRSAQSLYQRFRDEGQKCTLYHSRYKYLDRVQRHRDFIHSFDSHAGPVVGIATQVAEMSLDIDSDVLLSEIAPVPALIQRLGRLNRRVTPENPGQPREAHFFAVDRVAPYGEEDIALSRQWLARLAAKAAVSQTELSDEFASLDPGADVEHFIGQLPFFRPDWHTVSESLREPGYTANIILETDARRVSQGQEHLMNVVIPMPLRTFEFPVFKSAFLVPDDAIHYDALEGASWI